MALHATLDTTDHHKVGYIQTSDPGAIGTGKVWVDTTGGVGGWIIYIRNAADTGWELLGGAGGDSTAIHDNVSGEINAVTEKVTLTDNDLVLIEDSAASNAKKRAKVSAFGGTNAIHDDVSGEIAAVTEKVALVGNDLVLIEDSESSNAKKRAKVSSLLSNRVEIEVHNGTGSGMSAGDLCYISGDSSGTPLVTLADADAASTATKMLVCIAETIADGNDGQAVVQGVVGGLSGLTASAIQYVSTTAGDFTETAPSATGNIVRVAGYAISTTEIFMSAGQSWVEVA